MPFRMLFISGRTNETTLVPIFVLSLNHPHPHQKTNWCKYAKTSRINERKGTKLKKKKSYEAVGFFYFDFFVFVLAGTRRCHHDEVTLSSFRVFVFSPRHTEKTKWHKSATIHSEFPHLVLTNLDNLIGYASFYFIQRIFRKLRSASGGGGRGG